MVESRRAQCFADDETGDNVASQSRYYIFTTESQIVAKLVAQLLQLTAPSRQQYISNATSEKAGKVSHTSPAT
jgi:hypothetical protein